MIFITSSAPYSNDGRWRYARIGLTQNQFTKRDQNTNPGSRSNPGNGGTLASNNTCLATVAKLIPPRVRTDMVGARSDTVEGVAGALAAPKDPSPL